MSSDRIDGEVAAPGMLTEWFQFVNLTGHFQIVAMRPGRASPRYRSSRTNRQAAVRRSMSVQLLSPKPGVRMKTNFTLPKMPCSAMTSQRIVASLPCVEDLCRPLADLRQRLRSDGPSDGSGSHSRPTLIVRRFVKDQFPGIRVMRNIPVAARPVAVIAVFEGDLDALVGCALRQLRSRPPCSAAGCRSAACCECGR